MSICWNLLEQVYDGHGPRQLRDVLLERVPGLELDLVCNLITQNATRTPLVLRSAHLERQIVCADNCPSQPP